MFEYSIRKTKVYGAPRDIRAIAKDNGVQGPVLLTPAKGLNQRPLQQQQHPQRGNFGHLTPDQFVKASRYAKKDFWVPWVEEVKENFPRGKILTLKMLPIIENRPTAPFCFFVDFIQEVRQLAQWDNVAEEPRVIGLRPIDRDAIYNFAAPGACRDLTEKEMQLVFLHHPKIQERIEEALRPKDEDGDGTCYAG